MRKLLTIIATMIMCNAYGESVFWIVSDTNVPTTSCTAGDNITKTTDPTKSGYRFIGWKAGTFNDLWAINGTSYSVAGTSDTTWSVTFPYGTITGNWKCSTAASTVTATEGAYCLCCVNSRGPFGALIQNFKYAVFGQLGTTAASCRNSCVRYCASEVSSNLNKRKRLFEQE